MKATLAPPSAELIRLPVPSGEPMETQSGLFAARPSVFGVLNRANSGNTAAILMHPSSKFHGHYLLEPLAARGISSLALNSRYVDNDATLIVERVLLDLAAGSLRTEGHKLPTADGIALIAIQAGLDSCLAALTPQSLMRVTRGLSTRTGTFSLHGMARPLRKIFSKASTNASEHAIAALLNLPGSAYAHCSDPVGRRLTTRS